MQAEVIEFRAASGLFEEDEDGDLKWSALENIEPDDFIKRAARGEEAEAAAEQVRWSEELLRHVSPRGAFPWLPRLLDKRRVNAAIPDEFFRFQAKDHVVFGFQIPWDGARKKGEIWMPETSETYLRESCPRAIIISAGLSALDNMRDHGIELGHIAIVQKATPYRFPVVSIRGREMSMMILGKGEVIASEDTQFLISRGRLRVVWNEQAGQHRYERIGDG